MAKCNQLTSLPFKGLTDTGATITKRVSAVRVNRCVQNLLTTGRNAADVRRRTPEAMTPWRNERTRRLSRCTGDAA